METAVTVLNKNIYVMPQIIYSLISQFLVIPYFLLLWHFMHALNFSVKTLPFCISNPFASLVVLPAKNIPNDLLFLCNSLSWIATHCHNSFMYSGHAHKSQNKLNLTPFTEEWLVLAPLCGESRSVQLLSCVQHVWAKETETKAWATSKPSNSERVVKHTWGSGHFSHQKLCKAHLPMPLWLVVF